MVLMREAGGAGGVAVGDRGRRVLVLARHVRVRRVLEELPQHEGQEQGEARGARGARDRVPLVLVGQRQDLDDPALCDGDGDADQHGHSDTARHHVGQLGPVAGRGAALELGVEPSHEGLHEGLEQQNADHEHHGQQHGVADMGEARDRAVDQGEAERRKEGDADRHPIAAQRADQGRRLAETAEPLGGGVARATHQPDEGRDVDHGADHLVGSDGGLRRADGHQHLAQDAGEDDQQHHRLDAHIHGARIAVGGVAEPGLRQRGPQHDQEQEDIETPMEDAVEDRGGKLVLADRTGKPGADRGIADHPDGEDAQPVEQRQQAEMRERAQALLGAGATGEAMAQAGHEGAQDRFGRDRRHGDEAQQEKEARCAAAAPRMSWGTLVEQPGNGGEMGAEHGNGAHDLAGALEEDGEGPRPFGDRRAHDGRRGRLGLGTRGSGGGGRRC